MCENVRGDLEALSFAMDEVRLFLDTHPTNTCALKAYRELRVQRDAAVKAYEAAVGPVDFYSGPDGELGASMRYLSQRYTMKDRRVAGLLTDIGTEELAHLEMVSAIVYQLTKGLTVEEIKKQGFDAYFVDHTTGIWPQAASGEPFTSVCFASKGDAITDLCEDMAAEQKARTTYDNILRLVDDPDVIRPIRFLREREIVHFQRFGEALERIKETLNSRNFYAFNPEFD